MGERVVPVRPQVAFELGHNNRKKHVTVKINYIVLIEEK